MRGQKGFKEASVLVQWAGLNRPAGMCELQQQHSTVNPVIPPLLHHSIPPCGAWADENRCQNAHGSGEQKRKDKQDSALILWYNFRHLNISNYSPEI